MPGHRTHDLLTVAAAGTSVTLYWALTDQPRWPEALALAGSCLISGILFSPDLDLPSRPRRRWGPVAFLWAPYETLVAHRSWISHSAVAGPLIRLVYFLGAVWLLCWTCLWAINHWIIPVDRNGMMRGWRGDLGHLLHVYPRETSMVLAGFLLGGITHTVADVLWSRTRRRRRRRGKRRQ
jgi:uncharacterized metal-binding protein